MLEIEEQRRDQADQGEDRQRGPHHDIALVADEGGKGRVLRRAVGVFRRVTIVGGGRGVGAGGLACAASIACACCTPLSGEC